MSRHARVWVMALGALTACASSPPVHYYTLTESAGADRPLAETPAKTAPIRLNRVSIPSELDRMQLVRRIDATQLQILDDHRWAAPLDDMIHRVLSADLVARLAPGAVADPNEPQAGEARRSLTVDILDFYADAGCTVSLRAAWVLKAPASPERTGSAQIQLPAAASCSGPAALPAAMSRALAQLSERIAAWIAGPGSEDAGASTSH